MIDAYAAQPHAAHRDHVAAVMAYVADTRAEAQDLLRAELPRWLRPGLAGYVPIDDRPRTPRDAKEYADFAGYCEGDSPTFVEWARGVAEDSAVLDWLGGLPPIKRQPNLVFAAARFQASIRERADGLLTPLQMLRLVQVAAERGSSRAETALAVMYAKGVGTCHGQDYARAYYWFRRAADQGSPSAIYALSRYFDEGVGGVAPQELARSVTLAVASARAGFWPTREELASLLAQAKKEARDP